MTLTFDLAVKYQQMVLMLTPLLIMEKERKTARLAYRLNPHKLSHSTSRKKIVLLWIITLPSIPSKAMQSVVTCVKYRLLLRPALSDTLEQNIIQISIQSPKSKRNPGLLTKWQTVTMNPYLETIRSKWYLIFLCNTYYPLIHTLNFSVKFTSRDPTLATWMTMKVELTPIRRYSLQMKITLKNHPPK